MWVKNQINDKKIWNTGVDKFLSILSDRSFKYMFKELKYIFGIKNKRMIKMLILQSYKWTKDPEKYQVSFWN